MKRIIFILMLSFVISGCRNEQSEFVMNSIGDEGDMDTTEYPLIIDRGRKIVFQYGHMTADRGLKLYLDTIPYPAEGFYIDDSVRNRLSARESDR